jgi:acyl carrier protein
MSQLEPSSFESFQAMLSDLLTIDVARLKPEAYFITDLGVDSIRMVEVLLRLEEMGLELDPNLAWEIQTVGDAYRYYEEKVSR